MIHNFIFGLISLYLTLYLCDAFSLWPSDLVCGYRECCRSPWVKHDFNLLSKNLSRDLYGQHLAVKSAFKKIRAHIENVKTQKPLVLSFHGPTGTGKTFFTKLIAESFYKLGTKSKHVEFFQELNISPIGLKFEEQATLFRDTIESNVARCEFSMFVIDDAHLMNPKLLDVLLPYVDYRPDFNDVSYNRVIFIFISNSEGEIISDYVLKQLKEGKKRESITSEDMHKIIHVEVLEKEKPFINSAFVKREVVDAFIPFLPLEKEHVKECLYAILSKNNMARRLSSETVNKIVNSLRYYPEEEQIFSVSGCKRLEYVLADYMF